MKRPPPVLDVRDLSVRIAGASGELAAVSNVSFALGAGETLGIVGESGCGKTMTALALMQLLPPVARVSTGSIKVDGVDLLGLSRHAIEDKRGNQIAMIFQEPMTSLNPVMTIGDQITEALRRHQTIGRAKARHRAVDMLRLVRLQDPEAIADSYPHRLSGGMRQRAMIAMALVCEPRVLVADEPTTALDVTVQAQILSLLKELQQRLGTALVLITHDLGVIAEMADQVLVMYAGSAVETALTETLFDHAAHPYTQALMRAMPRHDRRRSSGENIPEISGIVPPLWDLPTGCAFAPRCERAEAVCRNSKPVLRAVGRTHNAACVFAGTA